MRSTINTRIFKCDLTTYYVLSRPILQQIEHGVQNNQKLFVRDTNTAHTHTYIHTHTRDVCPLQGIMNIVKVRSFFKRIRLTATCNAKN